MPLQRTWVNTASSIPAGVKIHYVASGEGPLLVMIHGFPDYWYTWRNQIPTLAENFQVVAIDLRGYNKSDKPEGVESYAMPELVGDVKAVIEHFGKKQAVIVGHDWGGAIAWSFAMDHPEMTERLVILNLPHPNALRRELANNPEQQAASAYARRFQQPDAASQLTAEGLAFWVKDADARRKYVEAFERSSFEAMLNYYKANYPPRAVRATAQHAQGQMLRAHDPRTQGHGSFARRTQRYLAVVGKGFDSGHPSQRRPLRPPRCG